MESSIESASPDVVENKTEGYRDEGDIENRLVESMPDKEVYPPFKVVLPTILCFYLAVFLTALVSPKGKRLRPIFDDRVGPYDHRRCDSRHIR